MSSESGPNAEMYSYEEAEDFPVDGPAIYSTVNFSEEEENPAPLPPPPPVSRIYNFKNFKF